MANAKRVVFSFDERSLESLEKLKSQGRFSSMGDAVRISPNQQSLAISSESRVYGGDRKESRH